MSLYLDGIALENLSDAIKVKSVDASAASVTAATAENAKYSGLRYLGLREGCRVVKISFKILATDPQEREQVVCDVLDWARGTKLEIPQRPDQYLNVRCTEYPDLELVRDYANKDIKITFTAYDPDWKACAATLVPLNTSAGVEVSATLSPPGTQDITFLEFEITNNGAAAMEAASVSVNGRTFAFAGLALAAGDTLTVSYDGDRLLKMATGSGADKLQCRTAGSDDDLTLLQRQANTVTVTTGEDCAVKLMARGQYR